jgi:hypothetical protein
MLGMVKNEFVILVLRFALALTVTVMVTGGESST